MPSLGVRQRGQWWLSAVAIVGIVAAGGAGAQQDDAALVDEGRRLFLEETFDGNGRTCGTCHPPSNNFTLDPAFVAALPGNDPLFVARGKLNPLEENRLIKRFGLILENVDGFDQPGVLRSAPHTLALRLSIRPGSGFPSGHATGWSGDGAPNAGTLRDFATGAVIQHFTKSIQRRPGVDFRLPTEHELDALEAFQLSLGRQQELNITPGSAGALVFADEFVELGRELFHDAPNRDGGTRSCSGCHANAGANGSDGNGNFDTGVALLPNAPACLPSSTAPGDGGLGVDPVDGLPSRDLCGNGGRKREVVFQGDGTFNTPPLVEAADTAPFFHNNAVDSIEGAVAFYTTDTFDVSPAGVAGGGAFVLERDEINTIGALLRALNVLENIRSGNAYDEAALGQPEGRARESVALALAETTDAIEVLTGGPVELFPGLGVKELLEQARELESRALEEGLPGDLLQDAIALKNEASALMVE